MLDEPDVRLDGVSHAQIVEWVRQGKAGSAMHPVEMGLKKIIRALNDAAQQVNSAVQQSSGEWEGSAADSATASMTILRDFDDQMHGHGQSDWESAEGQSGESAATRNRVPPIPLHLDAQPTILGTTVDPKFRVDARRAAEEQARLVLGEYQEATRLRLAQLPQIAPVPSVVLDTAADAPGGSGGSGAGPHQVVPHVPAPGAKGGGQAAPKSNPPAGPIGEPDKTPGRKATTGTTPTRQTTGQASAGQGSVGPAVVGASGSTRGDPGTAGSPPPAVVGGIAAVPIGENTSPPGGEPDVGDAKGGVPRAEPGPRSAVERVVEREQVPAQRAANPRPGTSGGLVGGAPGAGGKDDEEHHNRYHLPSEEPFETDEEYLRDGEFFVAPDVIGGPE